MTKEDEKIKKRLDRGATKPKTIRMFEKDIKTLEAKFGTIQNAIRFLIEKELFGSG